MTCKSQDLERLLASVDGDEALFSEIVRLFIADGPAQLARVEDAVAAGDPEAIYLAAHTFRGAACNFGESTLLDSLTAIEHSAKERDLAECAVLAVRAASQTGQLIARLAATQEVVRCAS